MRNPMPPLAAVSYSSRLGSFGRPRLELRVNEMLMLIQVRCLYHIFKHIQNARKTDPESLIPQSAISGDDIEDDPRHAAQHGQLFDRFFVG